MKKSSIRNLMATSAVTALIAMSNMQSVSASGVTCQNGDPNCTSSRPSCIRSIDCNIYKTVSNSPLPINIQNSNCNKGQSDCNVEVKKTSNGNTEIKDTNCNAVDNNTDKNDNDIKNECYDTSCESQETNDTNVCNNANDNDTVNAGTDTNNISTDDNNTSANADNSSTDANNTSTDADNAGTVTNNTSTATDNSNVTNNVTNTDTTNSTSNIASNGDTSENSTVSAFESQVVTLVNAERAKLGLAPLKLNAELSKVARLKSQDMIDKKYFSHTSPTYGSPFDMMKRFGINYSTAGENIASGYPSAKEVVDGWMNSPGHRANILNPDFTEIGVGLAKSADGQYYWTQMFINPSK